MTGGFLEQRRVGETALGCSLHCRAGLLRLPVTVGEPAPTMLPSTVMTTETAGVFPGAEPGQHDKAMLLGVVEALVEGGRGVGEFLERSRALTHDVGTKSEALNRILRTIGVRTRCKSL